MLPRLSLADRFVELRRTLASDEAPRILHASGVRELRRAVVAVALTGAPTRIVASLRPGEVAYPPGLWRRADAVLVDPFVRDAALGAGLEPTRLRESDAGAALRDVLESHRRRVAYRRRLERRNRVRRALR